MTPYYQDDMCTVYCGDCREILPSIQGAQIVLTDPPFFMPAVHYQSRVHFQRAWSDTTILATFWSVIVDLCVKALNETGHLFTFCNGDSYAVFYPEMYGRFDRLVAIVWDKGHVGLGRIWRHQHEFILAARWKGSAFYDDHKLRSDILHAKAVRTAKREHPIEKPPALFTDLIIPTTKEGDVILDPFMGSGTTLQAARALGRKGVGIEKEERYCEVAVKRLEAAKAEGVL